MPTTNNRLELCAVGDVMVNRDHPETIFELVQPILKGADITFGNCESNYSERISRNPVVRGAVCAHPKNVAALTYAGFDVMSFANNHHLDAGYDAFSDTLTFLKQNGIATCGAGQDINEAREPAIIERNGTRVAFLGYSTILFPGYDADFNKPGCAPIKIDTVYEQVEHEQPGTVPDIKTYIDRRHREAMLQDIKKARERADIVIFTPHWGLHFAPSILADYETELAYTAIDAGVDLVLGHHQHILKGVQVYKSKAIFHSMGNFAMDAHMSEHAWSPELKKMQARYPEYTVAYRADYPTYPFHPDARRTMIVRCEIAHKTIQQVSFLPCLINRDGQPEPLQARDERFDDVKGYVEDISRAVGFDTKFSVQGNEVIVS